MHPFDGVDFSKMPYINRLNWLQREYVRMVHKHAQLVAMQNAPHRPRVRGPRPAGRRP